MLQNQQNIGGISGGKQVLQRTKRCHTLNDACPADERENCSPRELTVEQVTGAIKVMTVGFGGSRLNDEDCTRWETGFGGRIS